MAEAIRLNLDVHLKQTEMKHLIAGLKKDPVAIANFAEFVEVQYGTDYYSALSSDDPASFVTKYLEWFKRQHSSSFLVGSEKLSSEDRELLSKSSKRFSTASENLWSAEGGSASVSDICDLMISYGNQSAKNSLSTMIRKQLGNKELIGVRQNASRSSSWRVPSWQVDPRTGSFYGGISEICDIFEDNGYAVLEFMLSDDVVGLSERPVDLIFAGDIASVVNAAQVYENKL